MVRALLPYFNNSFGNGLEGVIKYANEGVSGGLMIPTFLLVFYALSIYLLSKSEYKLGGSIAFTSLVFFILAMIAQTITLFNQLVIFIFALGIIVGVVLSFIENAR